MCPAANSSSRWCPTPEQLMILEEMYRAGTRTPNASQIQQITAHLSFYGKIEGKNVFYWFQNHKARDRQKLRRKLYKQLQQQQLAAYHHHHQQLMTTTNSTTSYNHNNNFTNNTQKHHSHFLGYNSINHQFPASASSSHFHQQLTRYNSSISAGSIPQVLQVGVDQDHAPTHQLLNYTWKVEIPADHHHHHQSRIEINESSMMRMYDRDWMMTMDQVGPPHSPARCSKPLKTLELFPITATNLKEECTSRSSNMLHLPCSSPATNQKL